MYVCMYVCNVCVYVCMNYSADGFPKPQINTSAALNALFLYQILAGYPALLGPLLDASSF